MRVAIAAITLAPRRIRAWIARQLCRGINTRSRTS